MSKTEGTDDVAGAILPDGRVNIAFLQHEIASDLSNDARYSAEDGMKKRAVHLSKDYDEFKNFVSVSQLAPVSSSEIGQLFVQRRQSPGGDSLKRFGPNKICKDLQSDLHNIYEFESTPKMQSLSLESKRRNTKQKSDKTAKQKKGKTPRNAMEFEREWRQCWSSNSPVNAMKYLLLPKGGILTGIILGHHGKDKVEGNGKLFVPKELRLSPEVIADIHKIEMDANTMEQIIESLHLFIELSSSEVYSVTVASFLRRWMVSLTKCGRFFLNVEFLEAKHKNLILGIMEYLLQERVDEREGLNGDEEDIFNNLLMLYKIRKDAP